MNQYDRVVLGAPSVVAYWPMDELSGSTYSDITGNARHLTITGSPVMGAAVAPGGGRASYFGTSPYATAADDNAFSLNTTNALTIEAWVRPTSKAGSLRAVVAKGHAAGNFEWQCYHDDAGGGSRSNAFAGAWYDSAGNAIGDGRDSPDTQSNDNTATLMRWHHVCWQFQTSSTILEIWINNIRLIADTTAGAGSYSNGTHAVGVAARGNGALPFDGNICKVAIYSTVLTQAQRIAHIRAAYPRLRHGSV